MATPSSPTETTASTETTSSSSLDDIQMSFTIGVTESTPYLCGFCDRAFPRLSYLKRHEQIHSDQMPFRCDYCQRLFKHKRSRDRHIKLHTGDKRYRCNSCESAFSRSDHLKIHMKTHDYKKPFQCQVCNRGYNTAAALTSHMQNHKRNNGSNNSISSTTIKNNLINVHKEAKNDYKVNNLSQKVASSKTVNNQDSPVTADYNKITPGLKCNDRTNISSKDTDSSSDHGKEVHDEPSSPKVKLEDQNNAKNHGSQVQPEEQEVTCGFCGIKCVHLDLHIREAHLHHLLFAGLLQNSFYHASLPSWSPFMHPPPLSAHPSEISSNPVHSILNNSKLNSNLSPSSPKKAKLTSSVNGILGSGGSQAARVSSSSAHQSHPQPQAPLMTLPLPLLCNQCSQSPAFPDFESFRIHLKSHLISAQPPLGPLPVSAGLSQHQCPYCGDMVSTDLETHIVNCHLGSVTTQYGCEYCSKLFSKPDELQKHLMDIHAHHLYKCSVCSEVFDSKVSIQVHFAVKHSNECRIYKCNVCGDLWNNEHDFRVHIKVVHLGPQIHHQQLHPPQIPTQPPSVHFPPAAFHLFGSKPYFKCQLCPEEFHIEFLLEKHMDSHHPQHHQQQSKCKEEDKVERPGTSSPKSTPKVNSHTNTLKCSICPIEQTFKSSIEFDVHMKSHQQNKSNQSNNSVLTSPQSSSTTKSLSSSTKCNICDERCSSLTDLAEHKLKKHCVFGPGTSQCIECHGAITTHSEYMRHFALHYSNRNDKLEDTKNRTGFSTRFPVPCIICKQTLMRELDADLHAKFHSGLRSSTPNKINESGSGSPTTLATTIKSELKNLNHNKSKPPSPVINEAATAALTHLMPESPPSSSTPASTTSSKRYQCIKCQESFSSEWDIQIHVKNHIEMESPNACKLCDQEFDTPVKLQIHLIEHNFNGGNEYKCQFCHKIWASPQQLQAHMFEDHLTDRPYNCSECQQKFWFPTELDNHNLTNHGMMENGDVVDVEGYDETPNKEKESEKVDVEQQGQDQSSKENNRITESNLNSEKGSQTLPGINHKKYPCSFCGKKFNRKEQRKAHIKAVHND